MSEFFKISSLFQTYETGRVIVTNCLGVTKGFKYRVSLYDLIFQSAFALLTWVRFLGASTDGGEVRDYLFRVFSFSGTRLATVDKKCISMESEHEMNVRNLRNQHGLILVICKEKEV